MWNPSKYPKIQPTIQCEKKVRNKIVNFLFMGIDDHV